MKSIRAISDWFDLQGWTPQKFQRATWQAYLKGKSGLVNAPTGSGKTYALWGGIVQYHLNKGTTPSKTNVLWITPLRALGTEIQQATTQLTQAFYPELTVGLRTGDTPQAERNLQKRKPPFGLVTTPESLHLLLSTKDHQAYFKNLHTIVVDEWHELMGSKRGVQIELAIAYLQSFLPDLKIWGISATIGNLDLARQILLGQKDSEGMLIRSGIKKSIQVHSLLPEQMDSFPWTGHLGIHLLDQVVEIIQRYPSSLLFTNTRAQCEIWYQKILEKAPELAGQLAMHHGSIDKSTRRWVEDALRQEKLKAVVCTSSLDLGVDFSPVAACIQIGSPKGVGRFMQRAGRSGHQPGQSSTLYFLPTHALELIESLALQQALTDQTIEDRIPYLNSFDVLIQFMMTLAVGGGFSPKVLFKVVQSTFCYQGLTAEQWQWLLNFIQKGSQSLETYDEYKKVLIDERGQIIVANGRIALRHRLTIGTIMSDASLTVKYLKGGRIGTVEEWFVSKLKPGDVFTFAGRNLEMVRIQAMEVLVRKSTSKQTKIPAWMGGRMSFSAHLSQLLRNAFYNPMNATTPEWRALTPLLDRQKQLSKIPEADEFLMETFPSKEGYHAVFYPFEGRAVHEAMAAVIAYRYSLLQPISFTLAYNDYGFELLSDQPISITALLDNNLFTTQDLMDDLRRSINLTEIARRKFRDIAVIAGLVFQGYPHKTIKSKHLQSSAQLFFEVFKDYEESNLLYQQAIEEAFDHGMEQGRLLQAFDRINTQKICWSQATQPTPFSFPLITDRLRERLSSEKVEDRIKRMYVQLEKLAQ